jgi:cytochrome c-type biogenesis protein
MFAQYYYWLSSLSRNLTLPLSDLAAQINLPLASALIFGLIGAFAPCQLSTGVAALGFLARRANQPRQMWAQTLAYLAGKVTVYTLIGGLVVVLGLRLEQISASAVPVAVVARKALGPLLIAVGLVLAGVLRLPISPGARLTAWLEERVGGQAGVVPAYLLGVAFAFTFCPTLFGLFFGLTIPLALASPGGLLFPGVFAVGTVVPLLVFAVLLTADVVNLRAALARLKSFDVWAQRVIGILFVVVGLNEIVLYWFL